MSTTATITIQNKKYNYTLTPTKKVEVIRLTCLAANIDQDFLAEDIPALLIDLPNLIVAERDYKDAQTEVVRFRINAKDKKIIEQKAQSRGFKSVSDYLRAQALA
jgi:hypothetical protein